MLSCRPLGGVLGECPRRREEVHLLQSCGPLGNAGGEHCSHAWLAAVSGLPCDREEGRWLQSWSTEWASWGGPGSREWLHLPMAWGEHWLWQAGTVNQWLRDSFLLHTSRSRLPADTADVRFLPSFLQRNITSVDASKFNVTIHYI